MKCLVEPEAHTPASDPSFGRWQFLMHVSGSSEGKEYACNVGDLGLISESRGSPGEGNENPLQYPCLENPMDRGAWWTIDYGVAKLQT